MLRHSDFLFLDLGSLGTITTHKYHNYLTIAAHAGPRQHILVTTAKTHDYCGDEDGDSDGADTDDCA